MDAPEKLMLRPTPEYGWDWPDPAADDDPDGLRYVRDDLHAAVVAERDNAVWERDENLRLLVKFTAERDALAARVAVLEAALREIAEAKITFDYVTLVRNADGTIDSEAPASPYDRGKAAGYREAADVARAALTA